MKKNLTTIAVLAILVSISALTSCGNSGHQIGILQLATHPALDKVKTGFKDTLEQSGLTFSLNVQNPEQDESLIPSMASNLVLNNELVLGIATSASQGLKKSIKDKAKDIPLIFSAVTDPIGAGLVSSIDNHPENVTGCSDMGPVKESIELLDYFENIDKVAGLYNIAESNSLYQIDIAKKTLLSKGWSYIDAGVNADNLIESKINSLDDSVDAIYIPTDNMIATAIATVKKAAKMKHLIVICGDISLVEEGGIIGLGVDYYNLGLIAGQLAIKILLGNAKASQLSVSYAEKFPLTVNKKLADEYGVILSDSLIEEAKKEGNELIE